MADTLQGLLTDPEFRRLSPEARRIVVDRLASDDLEFQDLSPDAQAVVKRRLVEFTVPRPAGEQVQELIETWAPVAGAVVGGARGAPTTALGLPGVVVGAGLGAAGGQALAETTRPLLTGEAAPFGESVARTGITGMLGTLGEGAAQGALRMLGKVLAPFAKKVTPEGMKAKAALETVGVGGALTPAQMTESRTLDIFESVTETSLIGGGRMQAVRKKLTEEGVPALVDDMLTRLGTTMTPTQIGQLFTQNRTAALTAFRAARGALYAEVDRLAKGVVVDTRPVVNFLRENLARQSRSVERALSGAGVSMDDLTVAIAGQKGRAPETTFRIAQEIRSKLLMVSRRKPLSVDDEAAVRVAGKIASLIDEQMEAAGTRMAPDALAAFRVANEFTKAGSERLENELIRAVAKRAAKQPSTVVPILAAPNKADILRSVQKAVDASTFERMQEALTTEVVRRAADPKTGIVSGGALLRQLKTLGQETADLVFKNRGAVEDLGKMIDSLERKVSKEGTGRIFIQLAQAGAATELIFHPIEILSGQRAATRGGAVTILLGPAALGRLFTNPVGVRWLTQGLRSGPGTAGFFRAMAQVVALSEPAKKTGEQAALTLSERSKALLQELRPSAPSTAPAVRVTDEGFGVLQPTLPR